jgi:catechol-2,3-dioxygenase
MKIKELKLYSNHLKGQKEFYVSLFGLELVNDSSTWFTVKVGETFLSFIKNDDNPYYHFAINIPSNQIEESAKWLRERVSILPFEDKDIINFPAWNAKSIYFYDADKNIVEFIARRNLNIISTNTFSGNSLLHVSEIGLPTSNVPELFKKLNEVYGLEKYNCDLKKFCAIGDEYGLFIVVNYNLKKMAAPSG